MNQTINNIEVLSFKTNYNVFLDNFRQTLIILKDGNKLRLDVENKTELSVEQILNEFINENNITNTSSGTIN